jgi:FkbM family methyltransferase
MQKHKRNITKAEIKTLIGRDGYDDTRTVVVEAGCNNGSDSQDFLNHFGAAFQLFCFECDPRAIEKFKANIHDPRCELIEAAVAAVDGRTQFFMSGGQAPGWPGSDWDMSGSIRQPTGHLKMSPWCTFNRKIEVETIKLDTWLSRRPELGVIDFLWADVQGAEVDLINGGREFLKRTRFFFTEFYQTPQYQGQINLEQIVAMLGRDWEALATYENYNVLLRNRSL